MNCTSEAPDLLKVRLIDSTTLMEKRAKPGHAAAISIDEEQKQTQQKL